MLQWARRLQSRRAALGCHVRPVKIREHRTGVPRRHRDQRSGDQPLAGIVPRLPCLASLRTLLFLRRRDEFCQNGLLLSSPSEVPSDAAHDCSHMRSLHEVALNRRQSPRSRRTPARCCIISLVFVHESSTMCSWMPVRGERLLRVNSPDAVASTRRVPVHENTVEYIPVSSRMKIGGKGYHKAWKALLSERHVRTGWRYERPNLIPSAKLADQQIIRREHRAQRTVLPASSSAALSRRCYC